MNRLQMVLQRLYFPRDRHGKDQDVAPSVPDLISADGSVRAIVMNIATPAGWETVTMLWTKVQSELDLPSPAIAISGIDAWQVWFSLAEPVPVAQATHFLELLRLRYLNDIPPEWSRLNPAADVSAPGLTRHASMVPALQPESGHWSAFVIPSLGGMFANEPWLESAPGPDSQADILLRLESIKPDAFQLALERLGAVGVAANPDMRPLSTDAKGGEAPDGSTRLAPGIVGLDPKRFLLAVMNDPAIDLHLRIEAAKALLPYCS